MGIQSQGKVEMLREAFGKLGLSAKRTEVQDYCWKTAKMNVAPQWVERMRGVLQKEEGGEKLGTPAANGREKHADEVVDKKEWAERLISSFEKGEEVSEKAPKIAPRVTTPVATPVAPPVSQRVEKEVSTEREEAVSAVSLVQIVLDVQQLVAVMGGKEHLKQLIDVL